MKGEQSQRCEPETSITDPVAAETQRLRELADASVELDDFIGRQARTAYNTTGRRGIMHVTLAEWGAEDVSLVWKYYTGELLAARLPAFVRNVEQYDPSKEAVIVYVVGTGRVVRVVERLPLTSWQ